MAVRSLSAATFVIALLAACGGSEGPPPGDDTAYTSDPDKTVVVGAGSSSTAQPSTGCVRLPSCGGEILVRARNQAARE
jgi:ABC-type phosphate transport system substrate-binding protein